MIATTISKANHIAVAICLFFSLAAGASTGLTIAQHSQAKQTPGKHNSAKHSSPTRKSKNKKISPAPFNLKSTRYWKLLGMSKTAVIKELTGDEEEVYPMRLLVYKDYIIGKREIQDMRDSVDIVFKDEKATMVRERFTYFTNYRTEPTGWYNSTGLIKPQPVVKEPTESPTLDIVDGMDMNAYYDEVRDAILKNFHSASECNALEIAFEIRPDGSTQYVTKNKTSGDPALDNQAMDAISRTTFPPLYGSHKWRSMALTLKLKAFLEEKPSKKPL